MVHLVTNPRRTFMKRTKAASRVSWVAWPASNQISIDKALVNHLLGTTCKIQRSMHVEKQFNGFKSPQCLLQIYFVHYGAIFGALIGAKMVCRLFSSGPQDFITYRICGIVICSRNAPLSLLSRAVRRLRHGKSCRGTLRRSYTFRILADKTQKMHPIS